jgi:hypothetical protein
MKNIEHQNQYALTSWWAIKHKSYKLPEFSLFAVPNGGARNAVTGAILKREGVRKGVPDLFLAVPNETYHGLFIEMKATKGVISKDQQAFIDHANAQKYKAVICYDWQSASDLIVNYLNNN